MSFMSTSSSTPSVETFELTFRPSDGPTKTVGWAGIYVTSVPEPGTLAMLLLAAGLLPFVRRTALRRA
jgi:hypothetical protein